MRLDDPAQPQVTLSVNGKVLPVLEILPHPLLLTSVFQGESTERVLRIENREERPVKIVKLEPDGDHFKARPVRDLAPLTGRAALRIGNAEGNRLFVHVQSDVLAKLCPDLSSSMRLCASMLKSVIRDRRGWTGHSIFSNRRVRPLTNSSKAKHRSD